jgi:curved DNA-binding protein CbpA
MENMGMGPRPGAGSRAEPPPAGAPPASAGPAPGAARVPGTAAEEDTRRAILALLPLANDPNLFARLGLRRGASPEEVKTTYLQLVRRFHPDRLSAPAFADLQGSLRDLLAGMNEAYSTLTDGARRRAYLAQASLGGTAIGAAAAEAARVDAEKAEACIRTRDLGRARTFLESALRADRRPEYLVALAAVLLGDPRAPDRTRARAVLEEAMKDPSCDRAFFLAGEMARADGDEPRAERHYRAALRANPGNADAARELKALESRTRNRAEARADAKK